MADRELSDDEARAALSHAFSGLRQYCKQHPHYVLPCVLCAKSEPKPKQARHKWVYPAKHVYVCKVCGARRTNIEKERGWWVTIYRLPDGQDNLQLDKVPPCAVGPKTTEYIREYADAIEQNVRKILRRRRRFRRIGTSILRIEQ